MKDDSVDSVPLAYYLEHAYTLPPGSPPCIFVASDQRLLRAAQVEGLNILNLKTLTPTDLPAFLAAF